MRLRICPVVILLYLVLSFVTQHSGAQQPKDNTKLLVPFEITPQLRGERLPIFLNYKANEPASVYLSLVKKPGDTPLFNKEFKAGELKGNKNWGDLAGGMTHEREPGMHFASFSTNNIADVKYFTLIIGEKSADDVILKLDPTPMIPKKGRQFRITFRLKTGNKVDLNVTDDKGKQIENVFSDKVLGDQDYSTDWSAKDRDAGMYFVRLDVIRNRSQLKRSCPIEVGD